MKPIKIGPSQGSKQRGANLGAPFDSGTSWPTESTTCRFNGGVAIPGLICLERPALSSPPRKSISGVSPETPMATFTSPSRQGATRGRYLNKKMG